MAKNPKTNPKAKTRGGRTHKSVGVSMDEQFFAKAEKRALELKMSFSEYARRCIENDLHQGGSMTIKPWDGSTKA
jgi:hypothetical protein